MNFDSYFIKLLVQTVAECQYLHLVSFHSDINAAEWQLFIVSSSKMCCLQATNSMPAKLIGTHFYIYLISEINY